MAVGAFYIFAVIFFVNVLPYLVTGDEESEYTFVLDKLVKETETSNVITTSLSLDNHDNVMKISGEAEQFVDIDNDWQVAIDVFRSEESGGEYKKMMTLPKKGVCDLLKSYYKTYFYESLKNHANAPDPDKCPVTKTKYVIKDYPLDSSKLKKFLKPGYYRVIGSLLKNDELKMKYAVEGHVEKV